MAVKLSVLDTMPLRTDQSSADTVAATLALAQAADDLGYERFWVSEHHDGPLASTNPPIILSMLGARTRRVRVGSGGVMLPNHSAFDVAEQFALLEAAYPGRVDLGVGRAAGGRAIAAYVLRDGVQWDTPERFAAEIEKLSAMLQPEGVSLDVGGQSFTLKATPAAHSVPRVWVLGSSPSSALLAGQLGMPYVFAHHFTGSGTREAVDVYRERFRPSEHTSKPHLLLSMNVVAADDEDAAQRLALPYAHTLLSLREGRMQRQPHVEVAERLNAPATRRSAVADTTAAWVIGTGEQVRARIESFAAAYGIDEVLAHPVTGEFASAPKDRSPEREHTLRLLSSRALAGVQIT